jgi:dolichol-phosphate mannosyltransferase
MLIDLLWRLIAKLSRYIKYSLVGLVGAAIHFAVLWALTEKAGLWYIGSAIIAITLASINNYLMNYHWTFRDKKSNISNMFIGWLKFLASIGATEAAYLGLLYLFTDKAGCHYMLGAFFSLSLTTIVRYIIASRWVWAKGKKVKSPYEGKGTITKMPLIGIAEEDEG